MPLKNTRDQWGSVSKSLHWLVVLLILLMAWIGLRMGDMPNGPDKIASYALHKSVGISILALVLVRIGWRWYAGAPEGLPGTPRWQERIASLTHLALYALLLAMPLSGWILNSASGFPLQWFGLVNLPAIAGKDHDLGIVSYSYNYRMGENMDDVMDRSFLGGAKATAAKIEPLLFPDLKAKKK